jgi:hypothetical protein
VLEISGPKANTRSFGKAGSQVSDCASSDLMYLGLLEDMIPTMRFSFLFKTLSVLSSCDTASVQKGRWIKDVFAGIDGLTATLDDPGVISANNLSCTNY